MRYSKLLHPQSRPSIARNNPVVFRANRFHRHVLLAWPMLALTLASAHAGLGDLRITEVFPGSGLVEVTHLPAPGGSAFTVQSDLPFCHLFNYGTFIPAGTSFGPGESRVFKVNGLNASDSDLWLYRDNDFTNPSSLITGLKYGPASNVGRTSLAVTAGIWPSPAAFVPAPSGGQSIQARTANDTRTTGWIPQTPSLGAFENVRSGDSHLRMTEVNPATGQVEITYTGTAPFTNASAMPFCHRFNYSTSIPANTSFQPGQSRTFTLSGLNTTDSDVWLYRSSSFSSTAAIITGMKYGPAGNVGRTSVAFNAGIWPGVTAFVSLPAAGQSRQLDAIESAGTLAWSSAAPNFNSYLPGGDMLGGLRLTEIQPAEGLVEITHTGAATFFTPANLPFCHRFNYGNVIPSGTRFRPGDSLVFQLSGFNPVDSDVWLYRTSSFANSSAIITGIKYGPSSNVGRTSVATSAGIWPGTTSFVAVPLPVQSLQPISLSSTTNPTTWYAGQPNLGGFDDIPFRVTGVGVEGGNLRVEFTSPHAAGEHQVVTRDDLNSTTTWTGQTASFSSTGPGRFSVLVSRSGSEMRFVRIQGP